MPGTCGDLAGPGVRAFRPVGTIATFAWRDMPADPSAQEWQPAHSQRASENRCLTLRPDLREQLGYSGSFSTV